MQITINQAQIEEAIRLYVGAQFREGKQFAVTLRATRGPEGYTADIDMLDDDGNPLSGQRPNPGTPLRIAATIEEARSEPVEEAEPEVAEEAPAAEEPEEVSEPETVEEPAQEEAADEPEEVEEAPAPKTKSLFGKTPEPA